MRELRILSLIASATEIVYALGLGEFQVGRSHECDYPVEVLKLPVCTRPACEVDGSSREIDNLVKGRLREALSIYQVDGQMLRELRPTHIITQTQCKVCAVSLEDVERALGGVATGAKVISLEPYELADLWRDITQIATQCYAPEAGVALIEELRTEMDGIKMSACPGMTARPSVAAIEWLEPLMAAGNWVPELIEMAGGHNLFGVAGQHSPWMTWRELADWDPDVIVALPCGFDLARTRSEMHWLADRPEWPSLRAVRNGRVFLADGNQYMNRPGPRLLQSLRIFAEVLHPDQFDPTLRNLGWVRF